MNAKEYEAMFELERSLWWYVGMHKITATLLREYFSRNSRLRLLDVGCGTGFSANWLQEELPISRACGIDVSPLAARFWDRCNLSNAALASADALPFAANEFDLVTSFDVLCDLEPVAVDQAVAEVARVLCPSGRFCIRLPAYDWLLAQHDKAVGNIHRSTRRELRTLLEKHDFQVERITYVNSMLFLLAMPHRLLTLQTRNGKERSDVRAVRGWLNQTLLAALKLEARLVPSFSFPFGLSVMAIAKKAG